MKVKNILVSQPRPTNEKSPYFDLAEKHKIKIDFRQFIDIEGIDVCEFKQQKVKLLNFTAVIITSKTAIDNYFRLAEELRITVPTDMKFFCVSESVALYLQKYITYRKRKIFFGKRTFDDLLEILSKHQKEKFLLPVADVHKATIPTKLKKSKINFEKAVMYKTVSADLSDLSEVNYDVLVFFSPSGIESLIENFPEFKQNGTKIASFGTSTAVAVKKAGLRLDIKAPTKEAPSMTMAIDKFIKKNV